MRPRFASWGASLPRTPSPAPGIRPYREAPVSPAVGSGMFTRCANRRPVLWSTGMNFFLHRVLDAAASSAAGAGAEKKDRSHCGRDRPPLRQDVRGDPPATQRRYPPGLKLRTKKGGPRQNPWLWLVERAAGFNQPGQPGQISFYTLAKSTGGPGARQRSGRRRAGGFAAY